MKLPTLRKTRRAAFTLIELLTVIAIIGILAGMLSVVVPMAKLMAHKMDASANCRSIAVMYGQLSGNGQNVPVAKAVDVSTWAVYLAQQTNTNEGRVWFIADDDRLAAYNNFPTIIINATTGVQDPTFISIKPKSWAVVAGAPKSPNANYPIVWTRGLALTGSTWDPVNSPWKGKGGHIGFASGTVAWYSSTIDDNNNGIFTDYVSNQPTSSVTAAAGPVGVAKILQDQ